jgi:transposase
MNQTWISPYLGEYLMSKSNTSKGLAQVESGILHAGVDLGLEKNTVVVLSEQGERLDRFSFSQDWGGYDYFLQRLEGLRQRSQAREVVVVMEPTNYFWKLLARELEAKGRPYHLVNPYTVKKHREGDRLDRSKDDWRDAAQIAELSRTGHYTETRLQKGGYEELRQYVTVYDQLERSIRREKQVIQGLAGQVFPELAQVFSRVSGETYQALLRTCACAQLIRQMPEEAFVAQIRTNYTGRRLLRGKLHRAYHLAATSIGVIEGLQAIQFALQVHLDTLNVLQKQLNKLIAAMSSCLASLPETPFLLSLGYLSTASCATLLAEIGDPKRYRSAAQWVKLAGIQPVANTSGKKQRSSTPISRRGRPRLRTVLYFTCLRMIRRDPHFAQLYAHLQRRPNNPLTKMQAWVVLMNKLLHILWALIQNQTLYQPVFTAAS